LIAIALGEPESDLADLNFDQVYDHTDIYIARTFEGLPVANSTVWDDNTYLMMRSMQKIELVYMFTREARRLAFSRVMRKPLKVMQDRVDRLLGKTFTDEPLRYMIYSAHDD
jgi:hypothetical protein